MSIIMIFSFTGCSVFFEKYPFSENEIVRVILKDGESKTTVYLKNKDKSQRVEIPTKNDSIFLGYYDKETDGTCYIGANGCVVPYSLDEIPRTLFAKYTNPENGAEVINVESFYVDGEKDRYNAKIKKFTNDDFSGKNYSSLKLHYNFELLENQDNWSDYSFCIIDDDGRELCEKIILKESEQATDNSNASFFGCIEINSKVQGNSLCLKFELLEDTVGTDLFGTFVVIIEYIA